MENQAYFQRLFIFYPQPATWPKPSLKSMSEKHKFDQKCHIFSIKNVKSIYLSFEYLLTWLTHIALDSLALYLSCRPNLLSKLQVSCLKHHKLILLNIFSFFVEFSLNKVSLHIISNSLKYTGSLILRGLQSILSRLYLMFC